MCSVKLTELFHNISPTHNINIYALCMFDVWMIKENVLIKYQPNNICSLFLSDDSSELL